MKEIIWEDWHIAAARASGRDKSGPYAPAGAISPRLWRWSGPRATGTGARLAPPRCRGPL
ncbi:MAG TPA: hypothetical protein VKU38_07050 [Ktedonobacteraceae bacterium]|nr:hypothetical protein [Ktedonobacteraceae bacterium]